MEVKAKIITRAHFSLPCLFLLMLTIGLYLTSLYNYLLFHTLAEIFSVVVASAIFIFAWNTRYIQTNFFFLFLGIAYLFTGTLDLLHCLSYRGMNIFTGLNDPASQLWVAARYIESISLLIGFFFLRKKPNEHLVIIIFFVITSLVLLAIFACSVFPECYVEGEGLTQFKKNSEYVIALLLAISLLLLQINRSSFDRNVLRLMQAAILFTIAAELSFTFYVTIYDLSNFAGHLFRIFSFYSIYRAVIENSLTQPYNMLFRELSTHKAELENKVLERTAALQQSTENLQEEVAERLKTEKNLLWELSVNRALAEISDALLSQTFSIEETEELVLKAAKQLTGSEYGVATSITPSTQDIAEGGRKVDLGKKLCAAEKNQTVRLSPDENEGSSQCLWSRVLHTMQGFYTNAIASYDLQERHSELPNQKPYRNYLNVPAIIDDKPVGQIALANKPEAFDQHDLAAVERLAAVFALSIQRKQMEKSLSRSERKYRNLFNDAPDMIHIVDQDKKIIDVNPIELRTIGYSKEAFIGTHLLDTIHPDFRKKTAEIFEQIFSTGKCIKNYETALITQNGEQVDVEVSAVPRSKNDRVVSIRSIMRNITDRKREELEKKKLEIQLRQSRKMEAIGTLAGGIAHDFNNILGPILGYTDMTLEKLPPDSSVIPWMQEVLRAGNRARDLVRQILTISRKTEQEVQPLRIQLIIKETLKLLRSSIPSTIEICQNLDPACGAVLADPTRIHQVIMNLCTNAYYAMRETGGVLNISLQCADLSSEDMQGKKVHCAPGSYLELNVQDTGCGISEDILEKIFEPYFTTKAKGEGTGLGLALVQSIILDFGGDIIVHSEPDRGTAFRIYLPIINAEKEHDQDNDTTPLPTGCERILVIDDDMNFAQMNRKILESLGYKVSSMTDSLAAFDKFQQKPDAFDLVLTDMTMPHMTGDELSKQMLTLRSDLSIILCTGFSELIDEKRAAEIGIYALVMKPFTKRELAKTVRAALDQKTASAVSSCSCLRTG